MSHIREVDGKEHTVLMMQVENEVGVLGDSRDHSPAANEAYAKPVPEELMDYLVRHKDTLAPNSPCLGGQRLQDLRDLGGSVGPGQARICSRQSLRHRKTTSRGGKSIGRRTSPSWLAYSTYVDKVAAAGKAEYDIPMYCNTWLQEPSHPRPGQFPSGCPEPEVHDIWRFGAPKIDILAPDLYVPLFSETCERFIRNGNPLFIPETSVTASNALIAYLRTTASAFHRSPSRNTGPPKPARRRRRRTFSPRPTPSWIISRR